MTNGATMTNADNTVHWQFIRTEL